MKQTCILVLGMHRSGTSALTGTLELLNIYLGNELMGVETCNEKGFFENKRFLSLNIALLSEIGSNWDDIFYNEQRLCESNLYQKLKETILEEFEYSDLFAIKDPRLVYLFPLYEKALKELGIKIKIIIPYRDPVEVALSLHKRNKMNLEKGMLLWAYHLLLAEKHSRSYPHIFTSFNRLLHEREDVIKQMSNALNINFTSRYKQEKRAVDHFLEPGLKHHNTKESTAKTKVPQLIQKIMSHEKDFNTSKIQKPFSILYKELFGYQSLFYHQEILKLPQKIKKTQKDYLSLEKKYKVINTKKTKLQKQLDQEYKKNLALKKELTGVYMGKSWLITKPFRKLKKLLSS